jgi:hypothetical protein
MELVRIRNGNDDAWFATQDTTANIMTRRHPPSGAIRCHPPHIDAAAARATQWSRCAAGAPLQRGGTHPIFASL